MKKALLVAVKAFHVNNSLGIFISLSEQKTKYKTLLKSKKRNTMTEDWGSFLALLSSGTTNQESRQFN